MKLSRSYTVLPKDQLFKGPKHKVKSTLLDKLGEKSEEDRKFENELDELEKSLGPLAAGCKGSLLQEMSEISLGNRLDDSAESRDPEGQSGVRILSEDHSPSANKKRLIEEVSSTEVTLKEPEYSVKILEENEKHSRRYVLKIKLPGITSVADCELDISEVSWQENLGYNWEN